MPAFGARSKSALATCHQDLIRVANRAILVVDFTVLVGHRGEIAQNRAFAEGTSKVQWPNGKHNGYPSDAFDGAPWILGRDGEGFIPWDEKDLRTHGVIPADAKPGNRHERYWYLLAGAVLAAAQAEGVALRWGGDWDRDGDLLDQSFNDLGHFERAPRR